jgi:hypothetical protein
VSSIRWVTEARQLRLDILDNALAEVGRAILQITVERDSANYITQSA